MKKSTTRQSRSILLAVMLATPLVAEGDIIRWRLTGRVAISDSDGLLPPDILDGTDPSVVGMLEKPDPSAPGGKLFVAYWSYDTAVADSIDGPRAAKYVHPVTDPSEAPFGLSVTIGPYEFVHDTSKEPYTVNVNAGQVIEPGVFGGDGLGTDSADLLAPFEYNSPQPIGARIQLFFGDSLFTNPKDANISSDALPGSLDLSHFDTARIQISGGGGVAIGASPPPAFFMQAWIEGVTRVPEPSALMLLAVGALLASRRNC